MQPEDVKRLIELGMPHLHVYVEGDGAHFTALVVSDQFIGKTRIQKQQLVLDTVRKELLDGTLHALSIQTMTPEEWQTFQTTERNP